MKIAFSACYISTEDSIVFIRRVENKYKGIKCLMNLSTVQNSRYSCQYIVESMTAEGKKIDIQRFIKGELQHTSYIVIRE